MNFSSLLRTSASIIVRRQASSFSSRVTKTTAVTSLFAQSAIKPQVFTVQRSLGLGHRAMASSAVPTNGKPQWIVIVPDKAGVTLQQRMSVRDAHLANLGPVIDSGFLKMGGAFLDHHPKEGEAPPMKGSALIVNADTVEEIRETLANDIYTTSGVWDLDNMTVYPFRCALNVYEKA